MHICGTSGRWVNWTICSFIQTNIYTLSLQKQNRIFLYGKEIKSSQKAFALCLNWCYSQWVMQILPNGFFYGKNNNWWVQKKDNVIAWWHQAISWANVDPDLCHHMASMGQNVLISAKEISHSYWAGITLLGRDIETGPWILWGLSYRD